MQLLNRVARKEVANIIELVSDANFNAGEVCRQVRRTNDLKQILNSSLSEKLAKEKVTKKIVKNGKRSYVSGAMVYTEIAVAVLWRQKTVSWSRDVFSSS